jgi:hypothetical protein
MCWGNLFDDTPETVRGLDSGIAAIALNGADTYDDHACAADTSGRRQRHSC